MLVAHQTSGVMGEWCLQKTLSVINCVGREINWKQDQLVLHCPFVKRKKKSTVTETSVRHEKKDLKNDVI